MVLAFRLSNYGAVARGGASIQRSCEFSWADALPTVASVDTLPLFTEKGPLGLLSIMEFVVENWMLFVALVVIVGLIAFEPIRKRSSGVKSLSPMESLSLMQDDSTVIIDVSEEGDYKKGHLPEALSVPLSRFDDEIEKLGKRHGDKQVIVYCRMGNQSTKAIGKMRQNGFENVHELKGGFNAWVRENLPTKT